MDIRSSAGITVAESDEHQRNWTDRMWNLKSGADGANYDRTRSRLNFEIAKGGVVQPIDTSKSITQRMQESLAARGITDPNEKRTEGKKNIRTLANIIFQGSRERMHEMAFDGKVDLSRGADNSHIGRRPEIEEWAKDMYRYVCNKFGEDNIIGFYVHLDEANPHVHCSLIPVTPENKISWKYWFSGTNIYDGKKILARMHNELAEVNRKYGLERGENISNTGAKHVSTEEYRRAATALEHEIGEKKSELDSLYAEINRCKTKVKSFETMVANLTEKRDGIEAEIEKLRQSVGADASDSTDEIVAKLNELYNMLQDVNAKLSSRKAQLEEAKKQLSELRKEKDELLQLKKDLMAFDVQKANEIEQRGRDYVSNAGFSFLSEGIGRLLPTLDSSQLSMLCGKDNDIFDMESLQTLVEKTNEVVACAGLLYYGFIEDATTYCISHGGASSPGTGWGRKDDDDDWKWRRRCLGQAARMMSSRSRSRKR